MDVRLWTFILVGLSFALYIGVAIWSRAGSTKDFYVAGTGVSPLAMTVSKFTPAPPASVRELVDRIRVPGGTGQGEPP